MRRSIQLQRVSIKSEARGSYLSLAYRLDVGGGKLAWLMLEPVRKAAPHKTTTCHIYISFSVQFNEVRGNM